MQTTSLNSEWGIYNIHTVNHLCYHCLPLCSLMQENTRYMFKHCYSFAEVHLQGIQISRTVFYSFWSIYRVSLKRLLYCLWLSVASTLLRLNQKYGWARGFVGHSSTDLLYSLFLNLRYFELHCTFSRKISTMTSSFSSISL